MLVQHKGQEQNSFQSTCKSYRYSSC